MWGVRGGHGGRRGREEGGAERSGVSHCVPASTDGQIGEAPCFISVFLRQDVAWAELMTSSTSPSLTGWGYRKVPSYLAF